MNEPGQPSRYRLCLDESGDHAYKLLGDPAHRYLALLGVWFRRDPEYLRFAEDLQRLKDNIFGVRPDTPVTLHRSEVINRKGPFGRLRDDEIRRRFDTRLLACLERAEFTMACVVIDKKNYPGNLLGWRHPYHYGLAMLLSRYVLFLVRGNSVGDVMAESRGREEDRQLLEAYKSMWAAGDMVVSAEGYQRVLTSREIKVRSKSRISRACSWRTCLPTLSSNCSWKRRA